MTEKQIKNLMKKYLEGNLTQSEELILERFDSTLFKTNVAETTKVLSKLGTVQSPVGRSYSPPKPNSRLSWLAIAASIVILIGIGAASFTSWWQDTEVPEVVQVVKTTAFGKRMTLKLSDGTKIYLNSGSTIEFPEHFVGNSRKVRLEGEAFFEVAKDSTKPFVIQSDSIQTTVLGTSFNVNTYEENSEIKVSVQSGKVKVNSPNDGVVLGANQQAVFDRKTKAIHKATIHSNNHFAWKDGVLQFNDLQMGEVVKTLERWYGVTFSFENQNIKNCHLSATYKNESLTAVLESIVYTKKGLEYHYISDREIRISGMCTD